MEVLVEWNAPSEHDLITRLSVGSRGYYIRGLRGWVVRMLTHNVCPTLTLQDDKVCGGRLLDDRVREELAAACFGGEQGAGSRRKMGWGHMDRASRHGDSPQKSSAAACVADGPEISHRSRHWPTSRACTHHSWPYTRLAPPLPSPSSPSIWPRTRPFLMPLSSAGS